MSEQPNWALFAARAEQAERQAQVLRSAAEQARCNETDSAGARCEADFFPAHEHRNEDGNEDGQ